MTRRIGVNWRKCSTLGFLIALLLSALMPPRAARSQSNSPISYTFEECEQVDEASLRDELNRITQTVFAEGRSGISVVEIVGRTWQELGMDSRVDHEVDLAVELVRNDTKFWDLIWSGWSVSKAEDLAVRVAEETFASESFGAHFDELSTEIAYDIVDEIRLVTAVSASTALLCVQEFIGDRFSATMADLLEKQIQANLEILKLNPESDKSFIDILETHSNLAGGVAVVIGTRIGVGIAKRLASTIAKNIVGKILARVLIRVATIGIPIVGWIIGGVLIVIDVYDSRNGALPLIRDSLQSEDVKAEMRVWMAEEVSEEMRTELPQLARDVANSAFILWQDFREKFARVLELAETNLRFKSILENTEVSQVAKLSELVALVEEIDPGLLVEIIDTGQFEVILALPEEALEILRVTGDSKELIAWVELAGDLIVQVIEMELYRVASPSELRDRAELELILALTDGEAIRKIMLLKQENRDLLLGLPTEQTRSLLLTDLSIEQLSWLSSMYLTYLTPQSSSLLANYILSDPKLMSILESEVVRKILLESQNFREALIYLTEGTEGTDGVGKAFQILEDMGPPLSGSVPWALFWNKNGRTLTNPLNIFYVLAGLVVLFLLLRISFRRQRQDVNVTVILPENSGDIGGNSETKRIESRGSEENEK